MQIITVIYANVSTLNAERPMLNANALCFGIVAVVPKTPRSKLAFYKRVDVEKRTNKMPCQLSIIKLMLIVHETCCTDYS